jgi:hypothetical protein
VPDITATYLPALRVTIGARELLRAPRSENIEN